MEYVRLADEVRDEIVDRTLVNLRPRGNLLDRTLAHHRNPVGEHQGLFLIVSDEDCRQPQSLLKPPHFELQRLAQLAVEGAERLVQEKQPRIEDDRTRQGHTLLLAARQLPWQPLVVARQFDQLQRIGHAPFDLALLDVAHLERKRHVLAHVQMGKQRIVLEHHADVTFGRRQPGDLNAVDLDAPVIRRLEAGHHFQKRRLPRAARTQDGQKLASLDSEGDIVEGDDRAEALADAFEPQLRRCHGP